jgi:Arc/MetJ-type ribon-helix-helix transcriptional regulator
MHDRRPGTRLAFATAAGVSGFEEKAMTLERSEDAPRNVHCRRRCRPAGGHEAPRRKDSLRWVTARLPSDLVRELEAHAKRSGTSRSDAIREALVVGMETIRGRDGIPAGRVEELLGALDAIRMTLDILGPPTLGTQRLLAHWATREGSVKVSEDELLAEVRIAGADEWEQAVTEAERDLPDASNRTLQRAES